MNAGEVYIFIEVEVAKALGAINKIEMALDKLNSKSFKGIGQQISGIDKSFSNLSSRIKNFSTAASQSFSSIEKTLKNVGTKGLGSVGKEISSADKAFGNIVKTLRNLDTASTTSVGGMNSKLKDTGKTLSTFGRLFGKLRGHLSHFNSSVWNVYTSMKDIFRVATGILMSQFIYRGILTPIRESISALWEFNQELEKTHISLSYFLEDTNNIQAFTNAMEDMAAKTPYQFKDVVSAARMFFRYGFSEQQILPMVSLIADMGAATGATTDQINHLAMALGQVRAKGRLVAEEAKRQIGQIIPINDILQEQLGISMEDLGDVYVSAKDGLTAIFDWVRRNYAGAAEKMEQTTMGIISSIKDNLLFIGQGLATNLFGQLKEYFTIIRDALYSARKALRESGIKAMLLSLFPKNIALPVWQLVYVFRELGKALSQVWQALQPVRTELMEITLTLARFASASLLAFIKLIVGVTKTAMQAAPVIRVLASAIAGVAIALAVAQTLFTMASAIAAVTKLISTFLTPGILRAIYVIAALAGVIATVILSFKSLRNWVINTGNVFASVFGVQIPKAIRAGGASVAEGFSYDVDFSDIEAGFEDVGKSAEDAGKKINDTFLASFDEVYQIPEQLGDIGLGGADFDMPDMPDMDDFLGDIGGIGDILEEETHSLKGLLPEQKSLANIIADTYKNLWGILKDVYGGLFDFLITKGLELQKILGESLGKLIPIVIASVFQLGNVIAKSFWGLTDAIIKSLAELGSVLVRAWQGFWTWFINTVILGLIKEIGQAISGLGKTIIKAFSGLWDVFLKAWRGWIKWLKDTVVLGLAEVLKDMLTGWWDVLTGEKSLSDWWKETKEGFSIWWTDVKQGFIDWKDTTFGDLVTWWEDTKGNFSTWWRETKEGFSIWWTDVKQGFIDWKTRTFSEITTWWINTKFRFSTWWSDTKTGFINWKTETVKAFTNWYSETTSKLSTWWSETKRDFDIWYKFITRTIANFGTDTAIAIGQWALNTMPTFSKWVLDTQKKIKDWGIETKKEITDWSTEVKKKFTDFADEVGKIFLSIPEKLLGIWDSLMQVGKKLVDGLKDVFKSFVPEISVEGIKFESTPTPPKPAITVPSFVGSGNFKASRAQHGAVVYKDQMIRVGEHNTTEMIAPLNESSLAPFARMIASLIGDRPVTDTPNVANDYVIVPLDRRGMINLERELFMIRKSEGKRRADY